MSIMSELVTEARSKGWATGTSSLLSVQSSVARHGWTTRPNRTGGPSVETLTPVKQERARMQSLSAVSGMGAQPLHTDGAHLRIPPDIVILAAPKPSAVTTSLWKFPCSGVPTQVRNDLRHGLFVVSTGGNSFLAPAFEDGRLRYDPGCMTAADERARRVRAFFADARESAVEHGWDTPDLVLVINNRAVVHARDDASTEPDRTIHRLAVTIPRETR